MATNDESILTEVKKTMGIAEDVDVFDTDIRMHINSALGTLNQLGIGPEGGMEVIDDAQKWSDLLLTDLTFNPVKSYIYLRVKMLFDPPANSWTNTAYEHQIEQLEWRINAAREHELPVPVHEPTFIDEDELEWWRSWHYLDGGVV